MSKNFVIIDNKGQFIKSTNYYELPHGEKYFYLSINAGAVRILVPFTLNKEILKELKITDYFEITYNKSLELVNILFEDHSNNPFRIELQFNSIDRIPTIEDDEKSIPFYFYFFKDKKLKRYKDVQEARIQIVGS